MADIIQMTTPDIEFESDVDLTNARHVSITFRQFDRDILVLDKNDLTITSSLISHTFTENETSLFTPGTVRIQARAETSDGRIIATDPPIKATVAEIFDKRTWQTNE